MGIVRSRTKAEELVKTARARGRPLTAKQCLLRLSILGRYSTKKLSKHDSVALSGELEARKAKGQIMLDVIMPLYHQYGGHVNPDLVK